MIIPSSDMRSIVSADQVLAQYLRTFSEPLIVRADPDTGMTHMTFGTVPVDADQFEMLQEILEASHLTPQGTFHRRKYEEALDFLDVKGVLEASITYALGYEDRPGMMMVVRIPDDLDARIHAITTKITSVPVSLHQYDFLL